MKLLTKENEVKLRISSDTDIVTARQHGRVMAGDMGFSPTDMTLIATAISEIARNIIKYAGEGEITINTVIQNGRRGITVYACDEGPGIPDTALAMQDGYSTSGGLGLGLPGARRLMDEFDIVSHTQKGTAVVMKKWIC